jgi:hypothetical protein
MPTFPIDVRGLVLQSLKGTYKLTYHTLSKAERHVERRNTRQTDLVETKATKA